MKVLQPVAAFEYEDRYGDCYTISVVRHEGGTYPWEVAWADDYNTFTLEGLRDHVTTIRDENTCPDEVHDEESDDYDHDVNDCDNAANADYVAAWEAVYSAAAQYEATGQVTNNLGTVLQHTLSDQVSAETRFPYITATINYSDTRLAIREAVARALENTGIVQETIDQWRFECDTSPDPLAAARQWVSC